MTSNDSDGGIIESITEEAADARNNIQQRLNDINQGASEAVNDAVTVASDTASSAGELLDSMGTYAGEGVIIVLDVVEDHIRDNDIQVELSDNTIHISGDEEGLKQIEADLQDIEQLKRNDFKIQYDREEGINIKFKSNKGSE